MKSDSDSLQVSLPSELIGDGRTVVVGRRLETQTWGSHADIAGNIGTSVGERPPNKERRCRHRGIERLFQPIIQSCLSLMSAILHWSIAGH